MRPFIYQRAADTSAVFQSSATGGEEKVGETNRLAGKLHSWLEAPHSLIS